MLVRLLGLDIVLHLATAGATQADDSADATAIYERHVVQDASTRSQGDHSTLAVLEPIVDPDEGFVPIQLGGESQRYAVLGEVGLVFERIELDQHALM